LVNCASTRRASGRSPLKSETEANSIDLPSELPDPGARRGEDLIAVDEAVTSLARLDPRKARVVELRFFGGLSLPDIGGTIDVARVWRSPPLRILSPTMLAGVRNHRFYEFRSHRSCSRLAAFARRGRPLSGVGSSTSP
jgi:hypothetical protein